MESRTTRRHQPRRHIAHDSVWTTFLRELEEEADILQPLAANRSAVATLEAAPGTSAPEDTHRAGNLSAVESGSWWVSDAESDS